MFGFLHKKKQLNMEDHDFERMVSRVNKDNTKFKKVQEQYSKLIKKYDRKNKKK